MKRGIGLMLVISIILVSSFLIAKPNFALKDVVPLNGHATVSIPEEAVEVTEGVFNIGTSVVDGKVVEGIMFIHDKNDFKKGYHHRPDHSKGPGNKGNDGESTCYEFLSKGAKWRTAENYLVDPSNNRGLDESLIRENVALDIQKWEDASNYDIMGDEISGIVDGADTNNPDNKNEVMFGSIDSQGAIAVTIVWGVFKGPPHQRELVEWDQVYDQVDFDWSLTGESGKMDFENIATHEIGHAVGMGHPEDTCTEETMYAYADSGETKKRDLNSGDIAGISELY